MPTSWIRLPEQEASPTTVHIVDDDPTVSRSIRSMLQHMKCEIEPHTCAEQFLSAYDPSEWQCLVLDLALPGMTGFALLDELRKRREMLPTLVLSANYDVASVVTSIQGGAIDFLSKPPKPDQFQDRVQALLARAGDFAKERRLLHRLQDCHDRLTPREVEVFALLLHNKTPKQIACALNLKPRTSHIHCASILTKFQIESSNDLVMMVARLANGPSGHRSVFPAQSTPTEDS